MRETWQMRKGGLFRYEEPANGKGKGRWIRIADPFDSVARVSDPRYGDRYGLWIKFCDEQGRLKQLLIYASSFHSHAAKREVCGRLSDLGLFIDRDASDSFLGYLQSQMRQAPSADVALGTGWLTPNVYVLPDQVFGEQANHREVFFAGELNHKYRTRGTTEEWRQHISRKCVGNSRLILAVCHAFASALLYLTGSESGGSHYRGGSSLGKTTAQYVCGSVLGGGGPKGFLESWNATVNGLEAAAALHNDSALLLDELAQCDPKSAVNAVYMLCNGAGKARMNADGSGRMSHQWKMLVLSSGELSLAEHSAGRTRGGSEVRLMEIEADTGSGFGLFENLHGTDPAEGKTAAETFADNLRAASMKYYGRAFRDYIRALTMLPPESRLDAIHAHMEEFRLPYRDLGPEAGRGLSRMALLAAGGELATDLSITGWEEGHAIWGVRQCFDSWILGRGGQHTAHDDREALRCVKGYIEQHPNEFEPIGGGRVSMLPTSNGPTAIVRDRVGYRRQTDNTEVEYLFLTETFRTRVVPKFNVRSVLKALQAHGFLRRQGRNWAIKTTVNGEDTRVYCTLGKILAWDPDQDSGPASEPGKEG